MQVRLQEVVSDLMGPLRWSPNTHCPPGVPSWQPTTLGVDKRGFLQLELLTEIRRVPGNQHFVRSLEETFRELATAAEQ